MSWKQAVPGLYGFLVRLCSPHRSQAGCFFWAAVTLAAATAGLCTESRRDNSFHGAGPVTIVAAVSTSFFKRLGAVIMAPELTIQRC
jgi:hypothetical protein